MGNKIFSNTYTVEIHALPLHGNRSAPKLYLKAVIESFSAEDSVEDLFEILSQSSFKVADQNNNTIIIDADLNRKNSIVKVKKLGA